MWNLIDFRKLRIYSCRYYLTWIVIILLIVACLLFTVSHIYVRWSVAPFKNPPIGTTYSGLWYRTSVFREQTVKLRIICALERLPCTKLIIARTFMIAACITSGIGIACFCYISTAIKKYQPAIYTTGFTLACLSSLFGMIGFLSGFSWIMQSKVETTSSAAVCALVGTVLSSFSTICTFFIDLKEST